MRARVTSYGRLIWQLRWECALYGTLIGVTVILMASLLLDRVNCPDILRGVPWHASSTYELVDIEKMFFHTDFENDPYVRFDFGKSTTLSSLFIENRDDLRDRAVPLVVEVSSDGRTYAEVARREQQFKRWKPRFPATTARHLRLRVARPTWFHLKRVAACR